MGDEVWDDNLYKNWVRGAKGLEFLQEGLKEFVGDKALVCRDQQLRIITNVLIGPLLQCIQCTSENLLPEHSNLHRACDRTTCIHKTASNCFGSRPRGRRKCPNGICSKLYDAIVGDHCYNDPLWKNSNPGTWSSDPHGWSYMKCFETTIGTGTSAHNTDASGLLSILINYRSIQNWLACHNMGSNAVCPFYKARSIRNEILHKSKMEIDDHSLDEYIDAFITVLEDPKCLLSYAGSQDAVQKLQQLKSKQINISQMDEKNILKTRKVALAELEEKKKEVLTEIQDKVSTGLKEIKDKVSTGLTDLNTNRADTLQEMSNERNEALEEIKDKVSTGLTDLNTNRADALQEMSEERNEALEEIKDKVSTGLTDLNTNRADALHEMSEERNDALEEIRDKVSTGLTDLTRNRSDALQEMSEERNEALEEIKDKVSTGLTDLNTNRADALHEMSEERNEALEEIKDKVSAGLADLNTNRADALHEMSEERNEALEQIKDKVSTGLTDLNTNRADTLKEMSNERNEALEEIKNNVSTGLTDLNTNRADALHEMSEERNEALEQIKDKVSTGLTDLNTNRADALQAMSKERNEALEQIKDKISAGLTELTVKNEGVLYEMSKGNTDTLEKIESATSAGLTELNEKSADALKQISGERTEVVDKIKDMASAVIVEATDARKEAVQKISAAGTEVLETIYDRHQNILTNIEEAKSNLLNKPTNYEPLSAQVKTPVLGEDEANLKLKTDLQDNLISFYRDQHGTISLSPLIKEDITVLEFYVMPEIYSVNEQRTQDGVKEVKTRVSPFRNLFYKKNKSCQKIYLTADAGLGKTAFSKRLALTWCHAKNPHTEEGQFFSQEEIQAMNEFRFVFLILLRDSSSECDIDDLILTQVMSELPRPYTRENLENILFKERCLVILDGLDEWCHPSNSCKRKKTSIPHRKVREQTSVLTTTRPWKLSVSGLHSSQIDPKLELMGLDQNSANALKKSVISHLRADKNEYEVQQDVEEFTRTLQEKQISDLETIPLLLTYLLFLWCNRIELGQSQCELYSQMIELLLSRTVQNNQELSPKVDLHQDDIPQCLSQQTHCTQFYSLLKDLGQLAYQTLFKETKVENTLVFDSSVAELCLNKDCLTFCLKTGIITQSKVPGTLLQQKSKVSFAHKTVQEYFAALYIRSTPDQTSVPETVLSKCTCVKDILEMSKILIFLSGFNVNVSSSISRELMKIINEDEITRVYRSSLGTSEPLKQFQDMCISCCKELQHDTEVSFCLQDVFIDKSCQQEQYRENLKQLTSRNKQNIRSLYIYMYDTPFSSAQEVIEYFALSDLENIEKIRYRGKYNDRDILPLLKRSVQSLSLSCSKSSWSDLLYEKVTSLQNLEAIDISEFEMSHEQLTLLYDYISHRHCMREIELSSLECSDHGWNICTGYSLQLSKHSQLRKISLWYIPVSELNINMSSLEKCELQNLSNPDLVLRFINCVPADSKVNTFVCKNLESSAAIETIQQTLPLLVHVESVWLSRINLGNINLCTSEMVNLECVDLWRLTLPASLLRSIVTVLQQLTQTVTVFIYDCNITPESEFVTVKEEIKQSSQFRVSVDSEYRRGKILKFETIKDGD